MLAQVEAFRDGDWVLVTSSEGMLADGAWSNIFDFASEADNALWRVRPTGRFTDSRWGLVEVRGRA